MSTSKNLLKENRNYLIGSNVKKFPFPQKNNGLRSYNKIGK